MSDTNIDKTEDVEPLEVFVGANFPKSLSARILRECAMHKRTKAYMFRELVEEALTAREKARQPPAPTPSRPGRI